MINKIQSNSPTPTVKSAKSDELPPEQAKKLKQAAEEFEAIFVNLMLKSMRDSVQKSGLLDGGNGEDIFRGMLDQEYAKSMAAERKTQIADAIEREMKDLLIATSKVSDFRGLDAYQKQIRHDPDLSAGAQNGLKLP
jgi:flagellar protein FlgJ